MPASVSIAIPCFNSSESVGKAVESALAQTWPNVEVLVVDDGSSDTSGELLREYGDRIRLFTTDHRGGNHARNRALREASGEWMQFLDADDFLLPDKIQLQFEEGGDMEAVDVLYGPVLIEQDRGNGVTTEINPIDANVDIFAQWLAWHLPQTGGALWRRKPMLRIGGWNESMPCCQEHELYLRALQAGLRFRKTSSARAVYRIWSEDTVCRRDPLQLLEVRTELIDRMCHWLGETGRLEEVHRETAGRICFEMARSLATSDLDRATRYHDERKQRGLIHVQGPAAPASYRIAYRLLGFRGAEALARRIR